MLTNIVELIYAHHSTKRWLSFFTWRFNLW